MIHTIKCTYLKEGRVKKSAFFPYFMSRRTFQDGVFTQVIHVAIIAYKF